MFCFRLTSIIILFVQPGNCLWEETRSIPIMSRKVRHIIFPEGTTMGVSVTILTLWRWALWESPPIVKPLNSYPAFYRTWNFITTFTSALHLSLYWPKPVQSSPPNPIYTRSILMLSTHLHLGLLNGLFSSGFPAKITYTPSSSPPICTTCPGHLLIIDMIILFTLSEEYRSWSYSLCLQRTVRTRISDTCI
jgi:hypothetical protein